MNSNRCQFKAVLRKDQRGVGGGFDDQRRVLNGTKRHTVNASTLLTPAPAPAPAPSLSPPIIRRLVVQSEPQERQERGNGAQWQVLASLEFPDDSTTGPKGTGNNRSESAGSCTQQGHSSATSLARISSASASAIPSSCIYRLGAFLQDFRCIYPRNQTAVHHHPLMQTFRR